MADVIAGNAFCHGRICIGRYDCQQCDVRIQCRCKCRRNTDRTGGLSVTLYRSHISVCDVIGGNEKTSTAVALAIIVPILLESGLTILMIAYKDLEVSQYWLFNTITSTQTLYQNGQAYIPFLVAAAYCAVSLVIGALVFRRQEMK